MPKGFHNLFICREISTEFQAVVLRDEIKPKASQIKIEDLANKTD
jgi:hypothetical protein